MTTHDDKNDKTAAVKPAVTRLPNRRALAALDQLFGYYDQQPQQKAVDLSYDDVAA